MFNLPFPFAAFNLLETQFKEHNAIILTMVRNYRLFTFFPPLLVSLMHYVYFLMLLMKLCQYS